MSSTYDNGATIAGGASYSYDGDGRRVKKVTGGITLQTTVFVYNALGQMVAEYDDIGQQGSGGTSYLTSDTLGTPRIITDASGSVKARHDYLPFGEEIGLIGGRTAQQGYVVDDLRQKFTQKERDAETGLDYFGARYYASTQGRFSSADSVQGSADNPQTLNLYTYVKNNPLAYVDPTGHSAEPLFMGILGIGNLRREMEYKRLGIDMPRARIESKELDKDDYEVVPQNSIEIINTGGNTAFEENKDAVLAIISRMSDPNGPCAAAFKRAGLPTPEDIVKKGLILGSRRALTDPAYNEVLGLTDAKRQEYNDSKGSALTIMGSKRGKPIILFSGNSFRDKQYLEDVPHEFIHAAGVGKWRFDVGHPLPFLSWGNDLSHYPPYRDIINSCNK